MTSPAEKPRRGRFLFSLRALMLVILVIALLIGSRANRARTQRDAVALIKQANGTVTYDYQDFPPNTPAATRNAASPPGPAWLRRWLGDEYFQEVIGVWLREPADPRMMEVLGTLDHLQEIRIDQRLEAGARLEDLTRHGRLKRVLLHGPAVNDAFLAVLGQQENLELIQFKSADLSDAGLMHLAGKKSLTGLMLLSAPKVTDASIERVIPTLAGLTYLSLSKTGVTDRSLASIGRLTGLKQLSLSGAEVSDRGVAELKGLTGLDGLHLEKTTITDAGLASLAGMTNLVQLGLNGSRITGEGFEALDQLQKLRHLWIQNSDFSDRGMPFIARHPALRTLSLNGTRVTDNGLPFLTQLPSLRSLWLNQTRVSDAGMPSVAKIGRLSELYLQGTDVSDAGLVSFYSSPGPADLFTGGSRVTDAGLQVLKQMNPRVKDVSNHPPFPMPR